MVVESGGVVGCGFELDGELVPGVVGAGDLFVEGGAGLEEDGVGEDGDAAGGVELGAGAGELDHVEADEADFDDVAGDVGDGDAIADADAVTADDEEVGGDREEDGLEADGDAGGDEAGEGGERAELGDEAEDEDEAAEEADDHAADEQELASAAEVGDVAEGGATPELADAEDEGEREGDGEDAQEKEVDDGGALGVDGGAPGEEIAAGLLEDEDFLADGDGDGGDGFEGVGELVVRFFGGGDVGVWVVWGCVAVVGGSGCFAPAGRR